MTTIRVKVAEGRFVRDPATLRPLSAEGDDKPLDTFWRRRIDAGDVEVIASSEGGTPSGVSTDDRARKGGEDGETPITARKTRGAQE